MLPKHFFKLMAHTLNAFTSLLYSAPLPLYIYIIGLHEALYMHAIAIM